MFGFLNIYKPKHITSHDVVAALRKITKIKQIGHTGTLDPFAEGVLPVCIGNATRLIEYLADDKAYIGTVQFGFSTDTYDIEGKTTKTSDKKIRYKDLKSIIHSFEGEIEQKPPIYSAIKLNGKKLYDYARKGINIDIPIRKVNIYKLEVIEFNEVLQQAKIFIECSKGTYIRSMANDIGEVLGAYGHLCSLIRIKSGNFIIENSINLDNLDLETINKNIINPLNMLDFRVKEIKPEELTFVKNGAKLPAKDVCSGEFISLVYNNKLISIAQCIENVLVQKKVFAH